MAKTTDRAAAGRKRILERRAARLNKSQAASDADAAQLVRIEAKQRLQRALRFERQIQALTRQLIRALKRSDDMLAELGSELMNRVTEPDDEPSTQGDPPDGSPEDFDAHPWKRTAAAPATV